MSGMAPSEYNYHRAIHACDVFKSHKTVYEKKFKTSLETKGKMKAFLAVRTKLVFVLHCFHKNFKNIFLGVLDDCVLLTKTFRTISSYKYFFTLIYLTIDFFSF